MARSDSFFIRARTNTNGLNFAQSAIDLGAYVDALGKSVLRIHNISVQYGTAAQVVTGPAGGTSKATFQLTTQSQAAMVGAENKSVISSGFLQASTAATELNSTLTTDLDVAPQNWTGGYLVAVEQIYLGVDQAGTDIINGISVVLECTVETMTSASAMALALSQQ